MLSPSPRVPLAVVVGLFIGSLALGQQLLSIGPLLPLASLWLLALVGVPLAANCLLLSPARLRRGIGRA